MTPLQRILGSDLPSPLIDTMWKVILRVYFVEYFPVILTAIFFVLAIDLYRRDRAFFSILRGENYSQRITLSFLLAVTILLVLVTLYAGFLLPGSLKEALQNTRTDIFQTLLIQPKKLIAEGKPIRIANANVYAQKIFSGANGWQTRNLRVFVQSKRRGEIDRILECDNLFFIRLYKRFQAENCVIRKKVGTGAAGRWSLQKKAAFKMNLQKAEELFEENLMPDNLLEQLPLSIRKYTYTSAYIVDVLLNKPCPGGSYELVDRIFYILSFYFYCFIGVLLVSASREKSSLFLAMLFLYLVLFLPGISLLFKMTQDGFLSPMQVTTFWPVVGALGLYGIMMLQRRFDFYAYYKKYCKRIPAHSNS